MAQTADITVRKLQGPVNHDDVQWLISPSDSGWSGGRTADGFCLGFSDWAHFLVSADGTKISWSAVEDDPTTMVHLVLDHVIPIALARSGRVVLHAACLVAPQGRCFAIAGESGWGKSTLAAVLATRGYRFLTDDCSVVNLGGPYPMVAAAYPGVRLAEPSMELAGLTDADLVGNVSSYGSKRRFTLATGAVWNGYDQFPLDTVFLLDPPDRVRTGEFGLRQISPAVALFQLLNHSFHLGDDLERADLLNRIAEVAEAVTTHEASYERSPSGLEQLIVGIEATLTRSDRDV